MRFLRAGLRLATVTFVIAAFSAAFWIGKVVLIGRPARLRHWRALVFKRWSATLLSVMGVHLEVSGEPPHAPFFLVSNHLSYVDILILASRVQAVFVAKSEVASWPVFGPITRQLDTIFIDRTSHRDLSRVLDAARDALERGDGVVVFPEGTSTGGEAVLPFRPSLLDLPVRLGRPVHYASLSYSTAPHDGAAEEAVCWWGDMTFPGHFWSLLGLSRIDARLVFGEQPISGSDRKALAVELHQAVSLAFQPVVGSIP